MWLDNLKELKKKTGMSTKQIAEKTNLPERTVARIISGDTDAPRVDTLRRIVAVLGGSLDDIFTEEVAVVGGKNLKALQDELDLTKADRDRLAAELATAKDDLGSLTNEITMLKMQLKHKEEIISLHNYYNKLKGND